jgi:hypothetical protein
VITKHSYWLSDHITSFGEYLEYLEYCILNTIL